MQTTDDEYLMYIKGIYTELSEIKQLLREVLKNGITRRL